MGVDSRIWLPPWVDGEDACRTVALLFGGAKASKRPFPSRTHSPEPRDSDWYAVVVGVEYKPPAPSSSFPSHVVVEFDDIFGARRHFLYWHKSENSEESPGTGGGFLMPRATAQWIAVGTRLVNSFGGRIDFSDSDSVEFDLEVTDDKAVVPRRCFEDGDSGFHERQKFLVELPPLSPDEFRIANSRASYGLSDPDLESLIAPYAALHANFTLSNSTDPALNPAVKPLRLRASKSSV